MRFFTFIKGKETDGPPPAGLMQAMEKFIARNLADGTLVQTGGLAPTARGTRIRISKGKMSVTDGPFAEAKEVIGGYAILESKSEEDALRVAKEFMQLHVDHWPEWEGESEVRQIDFLTP